MADSKTLKISFGGTIKVAEMLSLAPDHHQTKNICVNMQLKNFHS